MGKQTPPKYRRQRDKTGNRAFVEIDGTRYYLGLFNSLESKQSYTRLLLEWTAGGSRLSVSREQTTVTELIAAYWCYVEAYYQKDGEPTSEVDSVRQALKPLRRLYGTLTTAAFSPLKLRAVREAYIEAEHCRKSVNQHTQRIKRMFRWAVENEFVKPDVYHGLQAVSGLRRGRSSARESQPVKPVPDEFVDAIEPYVSRQVWAVVQLQRLTGMRSGEVVIMRGRDLDTSGKIWMYRPESHKTEHFGHDRVVEVGPKAQAVIKPFLKPDLSEFLFSPKDAMATRWKGQRRLRKTPVQPSQRDRSKSYPEHTPADRYTTASYRRAIARATDLADRKAKDERGLPADSEPIIPAWHPHQLRHNFATMIRKQFGIEAARILLGHRSVPVAEMYAEIDRGKAKEIMAKIG